MSGSFFNKQTVLDGIRVAMEFGQPNTAADRATFYLPRVVTASGNKDSDSVPFNPANNRTFSPLVKKTVPCAIEFMSKSGKDTNFGTLNPDMVKITLLDPDYLIMAGAEYVVISGQKFLYLKSEPILALGSIDIHITYWESEDTL